MELSRNRDFIKVKVKCVSELGAQPSLVKKLMENFKQEFLNATYIYDVFFIHCAVVVFFVFCKI